MDQEKEKENHHHLCNAPALAQAFHRARLDAGVGPPPWPLVQSAWTMDCERLLALRLLDKGELRALFDFAAKDVPRPSFVGWQTLAATPGALLARARDGQLRLMHLKRNYEVAQSARQRPRAPLQEPMAAAIPERPPQGEQDKVRALVAAYQRKIARGLMGRFDEAYELDVLVALGAERYMSQHADAADAQRRLGPGSPGGLATAMQTIFEAGPDRPGV